MQQKTLVEDSSVKLDQKANALRRKGWRAMGPTQISLSISFLGFQKRFFTQTFEKE